MRVRVVLDIDVNDEEWTNGMSKGVVAVRPYDVADAVCELIEVSGTFGESGSKVIGRPEHYEITNSGRRKRSDTGKARKSVTA